MSNEYQERVKNFNTIAERHASRGIEGCTSWRHFVVHQDRGWLLNAFSKIQDQVEIVRDASGNADDQPAFEAELQKLFALFEEARLNNLGDEDK